MINRILPGEVRIGNIILNVNEAIERNQQYVRAILREYMDSRDPDTIERYEEEMTYMIDHGVSLAYLQSKLLQGGTA